MKPFFFFRCKDGFSTYDPVKAEEHKKEDRENARKARILRAEKEVVLGGLPD